MSTLVTRGASIILKVDGLEELESEEHEPVGTEGSTHGREDPRYT